MFEVDYDDLKNVYLTLKIVVQISWDALKFWKIT